MYCHAPIGEYDIARAHTHAHSVRTTRRGPDLTHYPTVGRHPQPNAHQPLRRAPHARRQYDREKAYILFVKYCGTGSREVYSRPGRSQRARAAVLFVTRVLWSGSTTWKNVTIMYSLARGAANKRIWVFWILSGTPRATLNLAKVGLFLSAPFSVWAAKSKWSVFILFVFFSPNTFGFYTVMCLINFVACNKTISVFRKTAQNSLRAMWIKIVQVSFSFTSNILYARRLSKSEPLGCGCFEDMYTVRLMNRVGWSYGLSNSHRPFVLCNYYRLLYCTKIIFLISVWFNLKLCREIISCTRYKIYPRTTGKLMFGVGGHWVNSVMLYG